MFTAKGEQVIRELQIQFRARFIRANPGCNENDVERAFLYAIMQGANVRSESIRNLIAEIR